MCLRACVRVVCGLYDCDYKLLICLYLPIVQFLHINTLALIYFDLVNCICVSGALLHIVNCSLNELLLSHR